jgi:hypothetical protein
VPEREKQKATVALRVPGAGRGNDELFDLAPGEGGRSVLGSPVRAVPRRAPPGSRASVALFPVFAGLPVLSKTPFRDSPESLINRPPAFSAFYKIRPFVEGGHGPAKVKTMVKSSNATTRREIE